jgi:hypothetical protein
MADTIIKRLQIGMEGGFTSGSGSIYNGGSPVAANRRIAVEKNATMDLEPIFDTLVEARGVYAGVFTHTLQMASVKGKLSALVYPDDLYYFARLAASGAPITTTLPATPAALLAATAVAATNMLTTQPNVAGDNALGKILAVTLSNATSNTTAVTFTLTGTNIAGSPLTEQVAFSAGTQTPSAVGGGTGALSCTLYTKNYFKSVTSITSSAQPSGDQIAVGGINGFLSLFVLDMAISTLLSATLEYLDATAAWQIPGLVANKLELNATMGKSYRTTLDVLGQKKCPW